MRWRCGHDFIAFFQQLFCGCSLGIGVTVNGAERFADRNFVAELFMNDDSNGGIDRIFFAFAASAENYAGGTDLLACNCRDISREVTRHFDAVLCGRKPRRIVDYADIASLELDHLTEPVEGFT